MKLFPLISVALICLSVQFLGFLFTVACLFLPTAIFSYLAGSGLKFHAKLCLSTAALSALTGFLLSLQFTRLPTVPSVVVSMFMIALVSSGTAKLSRT